MEKGDPRRGAAVASVKNPSVSKIGQDPLLGQRVHDDAPLSTQTILFCKDQKGWKRIEGK